MKSREEKFARILAIADMLSKHTYEWNRPKIEERYRTAFRRNPKKVLGLIHKDLLDYQHKWNEREWRMFEILGEEIAELELEELTNEDLNEMYHLHLSKAKVEIWNVIGVEEASAITGLSPGTIKNYCASGKIEAKKIGKTWVIDKSKLEEEYKMEIVKTEFIEGFEKDMEHVVSDGDYEYVLSKVTFGDRSEKFEVSLEIDGLGNSDEPKYFETEEEARDYIKNEL